MKKKEKKDSDNRSFDRFSFERNWKGDVSSIVRNFYKRSNEYDWKKGVVSGRNKDLLYLSNVSFVLDIIAYRMHLVDFSIFKVSVCKIMKNGLVNVSEVEF